MSKREWLKEEYQDLMDKEEDDYIVTVTEQGDESILDTIGNVLFGPWYWTVTRGMLRIDSGFARTFKGARRKGRSAAEMHRESRRRGEKAYTFTVNGRIN